MQRSRVVFPQPEGPRSTVKLPSAIVRLTSSSARTTPPSGVPNSLVTPRTVSAFADIPPSFAKGVVPRSIGGQANNVRKGDQAISSTRDAVGRVARPGVTPALIAQAALTILDESDDPSALTMRGLAGKLGIQAPSLYAHVEGIDQVIDLVHALINSSIVVSALDGSDDLEDLRSFCHAYRDAYRAHPIAAVIITSRTINLEHALDVYEPIAAFLLRYGIPAATVMPLMAMLDNIVLGSAVEPFADGFLGAARLYEVRHPALAEALRSTSRRSIDGVGFELGLDAFLATVTAHRARISDLMP